jgi:hypothetical protein
VAPALRRLLGYASWILPYGVYVMRNKAIARRAAPALVGRDVLSRNATLRNRHVGESCIVLGNGPSVKGVDLADLKGRHVFSVSNGYLHQGYEDLKAAYHCVPQITYGKMTEGDVISWFKEMDQSIGDAELFLNETEAALVERHGLFPKRKVHYLAFREDFDELKTREVVDLTKPVPRVQSVPVMVLMIAMYMGFKEIVLIGVDHNHFITQKYEYAFRPKTQAGKDSSVASDGSIATSRYEDFQGLARLWRQYRVLRETAEQNGISILNASPASALDEFVRTTL